jgi:hypothetical protein
METAISKAQYEVWVMKEAVYEKIKNIPRNKIIEFILKDTEETIKKINKLKKNYSDRNEFNETKCNKNY